MEIVFAPGCGFTASSQAVLIANEPNASVTRAFTIILLAEYAANTAAPSPQKEYGYRNGQLLVTATNTANDIQWLVTDQLGTPRMIFDQTGSRLR